MGPGIMSFDNLHKMLRNCASGWEKRTQKTWTNLTSEVSHYPPISRRVFSQKSQQTNYTEPAQHPPPSTLKPLSLLLPPLQTLTRTAHTLHLHLRLRLPLVHLGHRHFLLLFRLLLTTRRLYLSASWRKCIPCRDKLVVVVALPTQQAVHQTQGLLKEFNSLLSLSIVPQDSALVAAAVPVATSHIQPSSSIKAYSAAS